MVTLTPKIQKITQKIFASRQRAVVAESEADTTGSGEAGELAAAGGVAITDDIGVRRQACGIQFVPGPLSLPFAFTEHGAIQAANVLNSEQAEEMGVYVVRAFVRLRALIASNKELAHRLDELERRVGQKLHTHDQAIAGLIDTIRQLMAPPPAPKKRPIGFVTGEEKK